MNRLLTPTTALPTTIATPPPQQHLTAANSPQPATSTSRRYHWRGHLRGAPHRHRRGTVTATDVETAGLQLYRQGVVATRVRPPSRFHWLYATRVTDDDMTALLKQLAATTGGGVPLLEGLATLLEAADQPALEQLLRDALAELTAGGALATALARPPGQLDAPSVALIAAGERSGALAAMLRYASAQRDGARRLQYQLRRALSYPLALLGVALAVTALLLLEVVPRFVAIYGDFDAALPPATSAVIAASAWLSSHFWQLLLGVPVTVVASQLLCRHYPPLRHRWQRWQLRLPLWGSMLRMAAAARFCRIVAAALGGGASLSQALAVAEQGCGHGTINAGVKQLRLRVEDGATLAVALREVALFPQLLPRMAAAGERSGQLDAMLGQAADWCEEETTAAAQRLTALAEPLMIVVLGALIGGLILALYLPVFQLGQHII